MHVNGDIALGILNVVCPGYGFCFPAFCLDFKGLFLSGGGRAMLAAELAHVNINSVNWTLLLSA